MILSDEIIDAIGVVLRKVRETNVQWHELSDDERELLNLHFSVVSDWNEEKETT
jgi:hypothetical protein